MTKSKMKKFVAGFLALLMVMCAIPSGYAAETMAADGDTKTSYQIRLVDSDGTLLELDGVGVRLAKADDLSHFYTRSTTKGVAAHDGHLVVGQTYKVILTTEVAGYVLPEDTFITVTDDKAGDDVVLLKEYEIATSASVGGTITETAAVAEGEAFTVTATADKGYRIKEFTVDGEAVTDAAQQSSYSYAIDAVEKDYDIQVVFEKIYVVTFTVGENGTVTYDETTVGNSPVEVIFLENSQVVIKATAGDNYRVSKVFIDDEEDTTVSENQEEYTKTLEMTKDYDFKVEFALKQYKVQVAGSENGKVYIGNDEEAKEAMVDHNQDANITIIPDEGYYIDSITVGNTEVVLDNNLTENETDGSWSYKLEEVTEDQQVAVEFAEIQGVDGAITSYLTIEASGGEILRSYTDGNTTYYICSAGADITIKPTGVGKKLKVQYDDKQSSGPSRSSIEIDESVTITDLVLQEGWVRSQIVGEHCTTKKLVISIDETAPTIKAIADLGWHKEEVTITGEVTNTPEDGYPASELSHVVYSESSLNQDQVLAVAEGAENRVTIENGSFEFTITKAETTDTDYYIYAVDAAGNVSNEQVVKVQIDNTAPTLGEDAVTLSSLTPEGAIPRYSLAFGTFFNAGIQVTVEASDANSGVQDIKLYKYPEGSEVGEEVIANPDKKNEFSLPVGFKGTIKVEVIDKVGNTTGQVLVNGTNSNILDSETTGYIMLEETLPEVGDITISADEGTRQDSQNYSGDVNFEFTVSDVDSGLYEVQAKINGEPVESYPKKYSEQTMSESFVISTTDGNPTPDGKYELEVIVIDNAGNSNTRPATVYVDKTAPVISNFEFFLDGETDGVTNEWVVATNYGIYCNEDIKVVITAEDIRTENETASGVQSITYFLIGTDESGTKIEEQYTIGVNDETNDEIDNAITISIEAGFKGQIYAYATDNVGNTPANSTIPADRGEYDTVGNSTERYVHPEGIIFETQGQHDETAEDHVTLKENYAVNEEDKVPVQAELPIGETDEKQNLYAADVPVLITVKDTYAGIERIEWSVQGTRDEGSNQGGVVEVTNEGTFKEGTIEENSEETYETDWTIPENGKDQNLVTEMSKVITVTNNSNDIVVYVKMTDRAGNITEDTIQFSIDKTQPKVEVTYNNNTPDSTYTDIYKEDRIATITITERNFNSDEVYLQYLIKNTDKVIPTVSEWREVTGEDETDPDNKKYEATVEYKDDGDYTFEIQYKDLANNAAQYIIANDQYEETFTPHKFTIDKTLPTVAVTYDNTSAQNGNYYNAERTATITIVEHNFDKDRVRIVGRATDDGRTVTFPALSGWTSNGDTRRATIHYSADAQYTFDIEFMDMAGNSIQDYTAEEFYVDQTAPEIVISGVENAVPYNGEVTPIIQCTDTNYNANAVDFTLTGFNLGRVDYAFGTSNAGNGQRFTYANFAEEKSVDDIYTLFVTMTDMAGNETTEEITFSVNRFGSTYDLSDLKELNGGYLQNEKDVVFTEINVNPLDEVEIKITKNGTPITLKEGTDFSVEMTGGDGEWCEYTYTIFKSLFAEDAKYSVSIYSKDAAGNINENINEEKEAEIAFVIDKTNPVIIPVNLEDGKEYHSDNKEVSIEIKDNLVLGEIQIFLNGKKLVEGEDYTIEGDVYKFNIPESTKRQGVKLVVADAAGNTSELVIDGFTVSTNIFALWFNNTPLFIGSLVGIAAVITGIVFIILGKKKKKEEK